MSACASIGVLIVEDERTEARVLQTALRDMGYDAFAIAASAEEALACAAARQPDVVLMDIRLKGRLDGIQTAAILKEKFPLVVIYLTAHAADATLSRAKHTEPAGYLVKPVKDVDLRSMIEISLYQREAHRQRDRARRLETQLHTITTNVPIAIAYLDVKGHIRFANPVFCNIVSYPDNPIGLPAMTVLGETIFKQSYTARQQALRGETARVTIEGQRAGKRHRYEITYLPDYDVSGNVTGMYAIGYDVTEPEQLTRNFANAHQDLETILNAMPTSITSWDRGLINRFANAAARSQWSGVKGRTVGRSMREVIGKTRFESIQPILDKVLAGEKCTEEQTEEQSDGLHYWHNEYLPETNSGESVGLYALSFDVTELQRSHQQIRELALRLESVREEERRSVATLLHDGIAQDLFALKLEMEHHSPKVRRQQGMGQLFRSLGAAVIKCMEDIRQITNELRPVALASVSLAEVIADHARQFAQRAGLRVKVSHSPNFPELEESIKLLLFRAAQEALTNVARHAKANKVEITFLATSGQITMEIADDGIGITDTDFRKSKSLGLLALRERFAAIGWEFTVTRNEPHGTRLIVGNFCSGRLH